MVGGLRHGLAALVLLALACAVPAQASTLQRIAERGVLKVCSNVENRPFAYLSPSGQAQGFNIELFDDLRQRLSAHLGVPLAGEVVSTSGANRVPFLQQGRCDLILTGFSVTAERQRLVDFVLPGFYASGAVLLARREQAVDSWQGLRGQTVCSSHGSVYNSALAERYGVRILAFAGLTESAQALRDRRCVGQVTDEAVAYLRLRDTPGWEGFEIKLPAILETPWSMAVAKGDGEFHALLEGYARDWRDSGLLYRLEARYGLPHKAAQAAPGSTLELLDERGVPWLWQPLENGFRQLYDEHGWNFPVFYEGWTARQFAQGILITLQLALACMLASSLIGLAGALAMDGPRPLRWLVRGYVELLRNTPSLAQLYFLYFGIGSLLRAGSATELPWYASAFGLAAVCISLHYGAFAVEILRSGLQAVPRATHDAALALGYGRWNRLRHITLPIALRASLPALGNNLVQLIKGTSIAYAVAVPEVLYSAQEIWSERNNVVEMMLLVLLSYLGLMALLALALAAVERRLRMPGVQL
ncbi:ABC transporter substrate-binding protein/permease [Stutzerimonas kirkiae]|uniref:ABC transporter substrate-binding protein/permease n=1 Tax=Stutzerimonas kirkiae TaxID=2211392 RepID=UPI001A954DEC|nr:ABC transporter substrate-binding protein/permease [Stutzerimonas kirkiae]